MTGILIISYDSRHELCGTPGRGEELGRQLIRIILPIFERAK